MDKEGCFNGVWLDSFPTSVFLSQWNIAKYEPAFYNMIKTHYNLIWYLNDEKELGW